MMEISSCAGSELEPPKPVCRGQVSENAALRVKLAGKVFTVDRTLLEDNCEYFRALFQSGMKECQQEEICLQVVSVRGFRVALQVINGERPILDSEEIVEAVECAAFLQVKLLLKHLINIINTDNCLLLYHSAATYGLWELFKSAALFICDMYQDLKKDVQCLPKELIDHIESLIPSKYVTIGSHSPTIKLLQDFMRTVCYLDEDENDWKVLTHLPINTSTTMAGVTVLDNKIFIVGGVYDLSNKVVDSGFCYDVTSDSWTTFSSPQQLRYNCTLVGHEGYLYALGGEFERSKMSSVEKYNVSTGTWSFAAHLPRPASAVACTTTMGRIFICLWKPKDATEIYEYVIDRDEWSLVTTLMRHQSYGHCMVAHRDNLYVMRNGPCDDFLRCMMDCYNLTSGQWTAMPGQYENSKGALFTAVVRGDSVFTVNPRATVEYAIDDSKWRTKKRDERFSKNRLHVDLSLETAKENQRAFGKGRFDKLPSFYCVFSRTSKLFCRVLLLTTL